MQTLSAHVKEHTLLLILDNCEHLVGACASLADTLLGSTAGVRILATSREALHIRGEQTYPVLPLAVPDRDADAESLLRSEAVQLFVERARLQKPSFALNDREAPDVAVLCARLEGIPLALELAAARLRSLSVKEINERLHDRFKLLTGGSRVALERQQTLRALVRWSYDLLQEHEQILLDRLSIFVGGFNLEAAEEVCSAEPLSAEEVLDLVTSLVEKSLVMVKQEDGWSRYGMLETIREFAREHLIELPDANPRYGLQQTVRELAHERLIGRNDLAATAARHCNYYLEFAKKARRLLHGAEQAEWTRRVEVEFDNLRAAIALALAGGVDPVIAVKLEVALMRFRTLRGYSSEGRSNVRAALALPAISRAGRRPGSRALHRGRPRHESGRSRGGDPMLAESLAIRRSLGNAREIAATLSTLSTHHLQSDELGKARECEGEALEIFRELGDRIGEGIGLLNLGGIAARQGDHASASALFEQSLAIARSIRHQELESECEESIGDLALRAGNLRDAEARFARALRICRDAEDKRGEAIAVWSLGRVDAANGHHDAARRKFADALPAFQSFGMNSEALDCVEDCAALLTRLRPAGRCSAPACGGSNGPHRARPSIAGKRGGARKKSRGCAHALGEMAFAAAWSSGAAWTLEQAIEHALAQPPAPL